jgi:uncharacterized protein YwbE
VFTKAIVKEILASSHTHGIKVRERAGEFSRVKEVIR